MNKKIISLFLIGILLLVLSINCFADIQSTSTPINETLEPTSTQTEELPKTGDESSMVMAVLSFLMIGSGSGILYFTRKKES